MSDRDFSDSVKLEIIKNNLEKYNGEIHCEICNKKLTSINECHFDHIVAFAKGGKSTLQNCQILCVECNLKKNDKELKDFVLEEKAKRFFMGESYSEISAPQQEKANNKENGKKRLTKDEFDAIISNFINIKGDIHKVDFSRDYNKLPSVWYVNEFYGSLSKLKEHFGIEDLSTNWNRETIKSALHSFIDERGNIYQKDMTKSNKLPSLPCVLSNYPECKNFSDVKRIICDLEVSEEWTKESIIKAGKKFTNTHKKITQKDLCTANNLPTAKVVYNHFGTMANFQKAVGAEISYKNELITKEELINAVSEFFTSKERTIKNQTSFFDTFKYSQSTVLKRYGSFENFCNEHNIIIQNGKKAKYTKREVDDAISNWIKKGGKIPLAKELTKLGLPSMSVIMRFYENWKEPFYIYTKLYEEINRM